MVLAGFADLGLTVGLISLIWIGGAVLIKADDLLESRRSAVRWAMSSRRRRPPSGPSEPDRPK